MSVTGYAGMVNLQQLDLELLPPPELYVGQPTPFMLRITNRKRYFPSYLLTFFRGDVRASIVYLPSTTTALLPFELVFAERGRVLLDGFQVSSPFPVSFFVRSWRLAVQLELLVYPRLIPCQGAGGGDDGIHPAEGHRDQRGSSGEVERIVDYTGRESLRQIHWKHSARSGELKVKECSAAVAEPLVIDLSALSGGLEERVSCAAWMVHRWTLDRPVGLLLGDVRIAPLAGRRQMQQLLAALAQYRRQPS